MPKKDTLESYRKKREFAKTPEPSGKPAKIPSGTAPGSPDLREALSKLAQTAQPGWIAPMLAGLTEKRFSDPGWLFEPKLDGERCLAFRHGGTPRLMSRNRKELNGNYPELVRELMARGPADFIADGEVVAFEDGLTSFSKLQPRMQIRNPREALRTGIEVFYYLFDLLYLDGYDLRGLDLRYRKGILKQVFSYGGHIRFNEYMEGEGEKYYRDACSKGWEGVIAKRAGSRYAEGRTKEWLKFKCVNQQEFVIVGYTDPQGARIGFGSLALGYYSGGKLVYAGKVGTGYDDYMLRTITARMQKIKRSTSPIYDYRTNKCIPKGIHWVEPRLVGEIAFSEWTRDGILRHPSFKGLRTDKRPEEVTREPFDSAPAGSGC